MVVTKCNKCNVYKEIDDFYILYKNKRRTICKRCCNTLNKLWRRNHPNLNKERYEKDKDKLLIRNKIWRIKNKEKIREQRFKRNANNIPKILLKSSLHRAKIKKMEHTLKLEDIKIPSHCPVLGIPLLYEKSNGIPRNNAPSIDRIDNNKGYTKDNIIIVSRRANVLKNDASLEELKKIVIFYDNLINKK